MFLDSLEMQCRRSFYRGAKVGHIHQITRRNRQRTQVARAHEQIKTDLVGCMTGEFTKKRTQDSELIATNKIPPNIKNSHAGHASKRKPLDLPCNLHLLV